MEPIPPSYFVTMRSLARHLGVTRTVAVKWLRRALPEAWDTPVWSKAGAVLLTPAQAEQVKDFRAKRLRLEPAPPATRTYWEREREKAQIGKQI